MKVNYDAQTDTLTVVFRNVPVAESDEDKPGVILDYDELGNIVSIGLLAALQPFCCIGPAPCPDAWTTARSQQARSQEAHWQQAR